MVSENLRWIFFVPFAGVEIEFWRMIGTRTEEIIEILVMSRDISAKVSCDISARQGRRLYIINNFAVWAIKFPFGWG